MLVFTLSRDRGISGGVILGGGDVSDGGDILGAWEVTCTYGRDVITKIFFNFSFFCRISELLPLYAMRTLRNEYYVSILKTLQS